MSDGARRGLATVALLKVNFDAGKDHLDMYLPFVLDAIRARRIDDFSTPDVRDEIVARTELHIPLPTLETLLKRATRRGFVNREAGRYFRNRDIPIDLDLESRRSVLEREHAAVAKLFSEFAAGHGLRLASDEEALALMLAFLEQNQLTILLESMPIGGGPPLTTQSRRESVIVAKFLQEIFRSEPQLAEYVQRMLEGLVLQNALLLQDISAVARKFRDLDVFFDTTFLLKAVGLSDEASVTAAREGIALLKATNARVSVFEKTIEEMRRVLAACQRLLRTSEGIRQLRPTDLSRFLLLRRYTPADVAQASALLENNLRRLGVKIRPFPTRAPEYTLDETELSKRVRKVDETDLEPRVMHDVDCIAAVLTLRRDRLASSLDDARAVFATTTGLLVRNANEWYRAQGGGGVSPIVHQLGLSNIAWLKKPAWAPRLKRHELVALCSAALQPTSKMWKAFVGELRKLEESGELTSDECVAVVASKLTDQRLSEIYEEDEVNAGTVVEIVERVKEEHSEAARREVEETRAKADVAIEEAKREATAAVRKGQEEKAAAEARTGQSEEVRRRLELRFFYVSDLAAGVIASAIFWVFAAIIAVGAVILLPGMFPAAGWVRVAGWVVAAIVTVLQIANQVRGFLLVDVRDSMKLRIARGLRRILLGG